MIWPFGRSIEMRRTAGVASVIGNIIWILLFGWELALGHLTAGIILCITIIGIPLGLANFKLIPISLVPLGVQISGRTSCIPATTRATRAAPTRDPDGLPGRAAAVALGHGGDREPGRGVRDHGHFRRAAQGGRAQALRYVRRRQAEAGKLYFTEAEWDAFVLGVRDGEFDLDENGNLPPVPPISGNLASRNSNRRRASVAADSV